MRKKNLRKTLNKKSIGCIMMVAKRKENRRHKRITSMKEPEFTSHSLLMGAKHPDLGVSSKLETAGSIKRHDK